MEAIGAEITGGNPSRKGSRGRSSVSRKRPTNSSSESLSKGQKTGSSTKSDSDSRPRPKLSIVLKRKPLYRNLEEDDIKYLWAVYKKNGGELNAKEYKEQLLSGVVSSYDYAWTMEVEKPVGVAFGIQAGPMVLFGDVQWFPWATRRNKYESMTNILNNLRKERLVIFYCNKEHNNFYIHISRMGVIRRVGHIHGIYENEPSILFETR